jgi:leader peptidase (prepilin peptidase)/N-methyltransferase
LLRGRCRDCGAPISARYPLVEFLVGIIFLTFCWIDVIVPMQSALEAALAAMFAGQPEPEPHTEQCLALLLFHLLLLCPLLSAALIDADGHRLPRRLITWPAAAGILLAFGMPSVQAVSVNFANHSASDLASLWALAASLVGLIAAVGMRLGIISLLGPPRLNETGLANATLALYAIGAFLGWQAVWAVGLAAGAWALAAQSPALKQVFQRLQPMAIVLAVTLFWCALEHSLAAWIYSR